MSGCVRVCVCVRGVCVCVCTQNDMFDWPAMPHTLQLGWVTWHNANTHHLLFFYLPYGSRVCIESSLGS